VRTIRIAVVDDSALCREVIKSILEEEGDIEVVGEAGSGAGAMEVVERTGAQLVTLDIEMPGMDGLLTVERIMARTPVPILIVTGRPASERDHTLFEAVRRGALDLVAKPRGDDPGQASALRDLVRTLARVPVMRHIARGRGDIPSSVPPPPARAAAGHVSAGDVPIVGIAASAGGPAAVSHVVSRLPPDFEGCVAVVQHLLPGFSASFAAFLRAHTRLEVKLAVGPVRPSRATVIVASDHRHLVLHPSRTFGLSDARAPGGLAGYRPSANLLFHSLAETCGPHAVGVVLSGMGDDGAAGLLAMRQAGAVTIAQDEATCAVYGMPLAARENGAAAQVLALEAMPIAIVRRVKHLAASGTGGVRR
jgi:two-component system chemotaxis response regulator CheB